MIPDDLIEQVLDALVAAQVDLEASMSPTAPQAARDCKNAAHDLWAAYKPTEGSFT